MSGNSERAEMRRRNWAAIKAYVCDVREARHKGRTGGEGGSDQYGSAPPVSDAAFTHMDDDDNRFAARLLNPIIEGWLRYEYPGSYFIVEEASLQHASWEDGRTPLDRALHKRLRGAVTHVEHELHRRHPGREVQVNRNPKHKRVHNLYESAGLDRSIAAHADYQIIVKRLEQIEQEYPTLNRGECMQVLSNRMQAEKDAGIVTDLNDAGRTSVGRIRKAVEVVNKVGRDKAS